jgi:hypothetical protein
MAPRHRWRRDRASCRGRLGNQRTPRHVIDEIGDRPSAGAAGIRSIFSILAMRDECAPATLNLKTRPSNRKSTWSRSSPGIRKSTFCVEFLCSWHQRVAHLPRLCMTWGVRTGPVSDDHRGRNNAVPVPPRRKCGFRLRLAPASFLWPADRCRGIYYAGREFDPGSVTGSAPSWSSAA